MVRLMYRIILHEHRWHLTFWFGELLVVLWASLTSVSGAGHLSWAAGSLQLSDVLGLEHGSISPHIAVFCFTEQCQQRFKRLVSFGNCTKWLDIIYTEGKASILSLQSLFFLSLFFFKSWWKFDFKEEVEFKQTEWLEKQRKVCHFTDRLKIHICIDESFTIRSITSF